MRSGRPPRARPPTAPYHSVPGSVGTLLPGSGPAGYRRGVNFRIRILLALCVLVVACVLLANVLFIRKERHGVGGSILSNADSGSQMEGGSHLEREEAMLERIRHGGRRGHPPVNFPHRLVHFDLKGAPLNMRYIKQILPLLAKLGATGILIEYEDMFPYEGSLAAIAAGNAYSKDDVRHILEAAKLNNLIVIPLVQTFGHLEFMLKLHDFKHLREVPSNPQALCPSRNGSLLLVQEVLRQVMALHQGHSSHIHIGSDEVFVLGECEICLDRMAERGWSKSNLFLNHVTSVVKYVKQMGMQPILWDDMFRQVEEETLRKSPLVKLVEIMVWNYGKTINLAGVLGKYESAGFPGVWVASAFKGASAPASQLPDMRLHLLNHYSWTQLVRQFADQITLKGIAITGWQRYDHFGALCELFPVGIPALALSLGYLQVGRVDDQVLNDIRTVLKCNRPFPVFEDPSLSSPRSLVCDYPGSQVLADVYQLAELQQAKQHLENTNQFVGWMTDVNRKYKFSAPVHVAQCANEVSQLVAMCEHLRESILNDLTEISDRSTALEWIATFLDPLKNWFDQVQKDTEQMLTKDEWPRRPFFDSHT